MQNYLIETKRMGIRLLKKEDIDYLEKLENDPEVRRYFPDGVRDRAKTKSMINKFISYYEEKGLPYFLMFELESGEFIGRCGFGITEDNQVEVGYALQKHFWGRGFASEALAALLKFAKENLSVDYIIAYADPLNKGSTRVMEKCGMHYYKTDMAKGVQCRFYRIKNR